MTPLQLVKVPIPYKGMNTEISPFELPDTFAPEIINGHLDTVGSFTTRPGITRLGNQIQSGKNVLGLHNFLDAGAGTNNRVIAVVNNSGDTNAVVYYLSGGTWTATSITTDTASKKARFLTFADRVIRVNDTNAMATWTGAIADSWITTGNPINPDGLGAVRLQYLETLAARVMGAGDATNPDRLYFTSVINSSGNITWDTTNNYLEVSPNDGDNISALKRWALHCLVFKKRFLYRWDGKSIDPDPIIGVGTFSQESVVRAKDGVYYHSPLGIYRYSGAYPEEVSKPIDVFIRNTSSANFLNIIGIGDNDHIYHWIGNVTINGVTITNCIIRYTISSKAWVLYSYPSAWTTATTYVNGTDETIIVGDATGSIQTINSGVDDNGTPITFSLKTAWYALGAISQSKVISKLSSYGTKHQGIQLAYQINNEAEQVWHPIGTLRDFLTIFGGVNIKSHRVRFKTYGASSNVSPVWDGLEILEAVSEGVIE